MANNQKNSSKVNSSVNNETLNVETIKAQLKAACANMTAKETKEYIKGLDGYSIKQTGANPDRTHATIYFGNMRVCNVENVQGIKADGTARGCVSTAKVNFADAVLNVFESKYKKFETDFTEVEKNGLQALKYDFADVLAKIQCVFETCNNRIAEQAKEAAKAKRAEAAKERATKKVGEKIAAGTDSEKIAAIAAALNVSYEVAATIYKEQKQTA